VLREHGLIAGLKWLGEWMRRHELEVSVESDHDVVVLLEDQSVLLFQSVRELLINAAKHAKCTRAVVRVTQGPRQLTVAVKDDGTGFNLAAAEAAGLRGSGAAGSSKFGIFSVRERMKAMGGSLTIESEPGQGTTATLMMPLTVRATSPDHSLSREAPAVAPPAVSPAKEGRRRTPKRIRVLLVDDHAMVRQGLRSVLDTYADMEVVGEAWNGKEAVALVRKLQPAVVIMDINMPGMTGIEATANIKAEFPSVVVIGLSVNAETDNQEAMKRAGAEKLLTKEAAVDRLYQAIQSALHPISSARRTPAAV
jgi:CheY-like chemotaxis protein/anti-sigma regulatory factor (Ser/Thr protein kinase)